jgi:hypothetical protein
MKISEDEMDAIPITKRKHEYDLATAVTFLVAGIGLGSMLTLLFASRFERALRAHHESHSAAPLHHVPLHQPPVNEPAL